MKINQKLISGFLVVSLLILAVSYISITIQERLTTNFQEIAGEVLPGTVALMNMEANLYHSLVHATKYASTGDIENKKAVETLTADLRKYLTIHRLHHVRHDDPMHIEIIDGKIDTFISFVTEYILLKDKGTSEEELGIVNAKINRIVDDFESWTDPFIKQHLKNSREAIKTTKQDITHAHKLILGSSAIILILALALGFFISRFISKPIIKLTEAAAQIGKGKLDAKIEIESKDEIGELATSLNKMTKDLQLITVSRDAFAQEVVEREKIAEALRESEQKLSGVVDSVTDAMVMLDDEFNVLWINNVAKNLFGPDLVGKKCYSTYHGHTEVCEPCIVKQCFEDGKVHEFETVITPTDGDRINFWCTASVAARDEDGRPRMVVEFLRDITDRKQVQREIETLKQQIEFILGAAKTGLDIIDPEFNIRYIYTEWEKVYGDPTGRKCYEYYMDRSEVCPDCGIVKALETKAPHVTEQILVKEGNRPIQVTTIPFQNDEGEWLVAEVKVDITERKQAEKMQQTAYDQAIIYAGQLNEEIEERKQAEEALRESEEKYRTITATAQDAIVMMDNEGNISYWNPAAERMFGYTTEEAIGQELHIFFGSHRFHESYKKEFKKFQETGQGDAVGKTLELSAIRKDGTKFPIELSMSSIQIQGKWHATGIIRDISERRRAEEVLLERESFLQSVFDGIQDGISILDCDLNIIRVNSWIEKMYSSQLPLIGKKCHMVYQQRESSCPWCPSLRTLSTGEAHTTTVPYPSENKPTGWIDLSSFPLKNNDGRVVGIIEHAKDITEHKRLEAQLQQAQKMEAIGTLAGGISHDFNNILQGISGYTQLLLMQKGVDDPNSRYLNKIDKLIQRARELTQQLLTFSRKVESKLRPVDLNQEVIQAHDVLKRTIPKMIDIELHLAVDLKLINADPVQLEQIMMNLGVNAKDAMPDGGKLIFQTEDTVLDKEYCATHLGVTPGKYVLLTISDTGHGMDKEAVQRIFEPFYTTKEIGKGTGLGLAMVYGIVKTHGGFITCYSEPGHGAVFSIYFPVLDADDVVQEVEPKEEADIRGGHETILLVDDEETLLDIEKDILNRYGYITITAESGESAIEIYKLEKDRIDLVILDIGMPGMGGYKCLQELLKIDPEIKVIIASGYPKDDKVKEMLESGVAEFVGKPYRLTDILEKVREVLDQG